jgi:hypothetical protein
MRRHNPVNLFAAGIMIAVLVCLAPDAHAGPTDTFHANGYGTCTTTAVSIPTTAGGTALTTASAERVWISACVLADVTASIYLSTGTPTSVNNFGALVDNGRCWDGYLGTAVTLKGLSSSGTVSVKVLECKLP